MSRGSLPGQPPGTLLPQEEQRLAGLAPKGARVASKVETIFGKRGISIAGWAILGVQVRSGERGSDQHRCRWLFLVPCSTS